MTVAELAYKQLKSLPKTQAREVLDFIGYLKGKTERGQWEDLKFPAFYTRQRRVSI